MESALLKWSVGREDCNIGRMNHSWNESKSSGISRRMKLISDQSSARLFCWNGFEFISRTMRAYEGLTYMSRCPSQKVQPKFFKQWPSSTKI
jgi:hypothetical protein